MSEDAGILYQLSNCEIMRYDVDDEHYYFGGMVDTEKTYFLSVTQILGIGGPFPEGLREWLRATSYEESKAKLESTGQRGSQLHDVLDRLLRAEEIDLTLHKTQYEKDAITTFIRVMRFLKPNKIVTEQIVADPDLKVAGTIDLKAIADEWRLRVLLDPSKYLDIDSDGDYQLKERWLDIVNNVRICFIWDHKFTSTNAYNHKVQVAAYKRMYAKSHKGMKPSRAFTWRYSPRHKFGFDFTESTKPYKAFTRIYDITIDYLGEFPAPPQIKRFPDRVRLYDKLKEKI